jgi:hypothetical protein
MALSYPKMVTVLMFFWDGCLVYCPQDGNYNTGAYKTLENEMADWIAAGGEVTFNVELKNFQSGRPSEISVSYTVVDPKTGIEVYNAGKDFTNDSNQTYKRLSSDAILAVMGHQ